MELGRAFGLDGQGSGPHTGPRSLRRWAGRMLDSGVIGPYRLLEPLGQGGMGIVYRARHTTSERAVALKTVKVPSPRWLDGIRREIHALTRIRHPGIVRIVDHGTHLGRPWYAMDLLEGESLRHFGQRIWSPFRRPSAPPSAVSATDGHSRDYDAAPISDAFADVRLCAAEGMPAAAGELRTVLRLMRRVCATLAFMHGEGFINCDLKPENILLSDGQPVIIDFGLTAHHPGGSGREELEAQRSMSGTLPYMSPEQIRGEFVDARSDLYSLGCLLYELVVGSPPFVGSPRSILTQHLSSAPTPPSQVATGVPPELERVILKLLEKGLGDRFGFADEVAAILAELSADVQRLADFPPSRPYLYRPRFVGRGLLLRELGALRERAAAGSGSIVLVGGESGVGKTRLAMELTRLGPGSRMQVVTSEASPLSTENAAAVGAVPFYAVKPLLRAVADRCQEGGAEVTERLLDHRRSVLAMYEPLLAQVPVRGNEPAPVALGVEASRQRLFRFLAETLANFAAEQPVFWVLDDLGWADELTLSFVRSLTPEYFATTPLFVLCTYRSEDTTDVVAEMARQAHVVHVALARLEQDAVSSMVGDMLAHSQAHDGFVTFVAKHSEGNPFFVAEYLRTAVTERLLYRDRQHSWQLLGQSNAAHGDYESLLIPRSVRELIEHRVRKLSPAAQTAGLAASVLGREADIDVVRDVAEMSEDVAVDAFDELIRRQVFEPPSGGSVRFAHDKLREVIYARAPSERLVELHKRAATCLETRSTRGDGVRQWATLGHHFAAARQAEPAARYLKLAADHARAAYANREAIQLYRDAIRQAEQVVLALTSESASWSQALVAMNEALADTLSLTGQRSEARDAYDDALKLTLDIDRTDRARIHRKLGKTWETQHRHDEALRLYSLALGALSPDSAGAPVQERVEAGECGERDEWIQIHIERLWVHYWLDDVAAMSALVARLQPIIERYGSATQRIRYLQGRMQHNLRRDRYVVNEETLGFARAAVRLCSDGDGAAERPMAQFNYGFALLFHNSHVGAAAELRTSVALAERSGDTSHLARCLAYAAVAARMLGHVDDAAQSAAAGRQAAEVASMREYVAAADANRAWEALRHGDIDATIQHASRALDTWSKLTAVFPFHWLALIPLLEAELARNDIEHAVIRAELLLSPRQQSLPGVATDCLGRACAAWRVGDLEMTRTALTSALQELESTGHR